MPIKVAWTTPPSETPSFESIAPDAGIQEASQATSPSYVVAIGASAGGLDALEKLFDNLPSDSGAAFVVIQHLSPDHKSIMDSLLARHTSMPIKTVTHNMVIEADSVYLIPPGSLMHLEGNRFLLTPKFPRTLNLPIDVFFQSLATNYKERSMGVVLSGTGSDGTRGAGAINEAGGLLIAQEPENAKFDGMPRMHHLYWVGRRHTACRFDGRTHLRARRLARQKQHHTAPYVPRLCPRHY